MSDVRADVAKALEAYAEAFNAMNARETLKHCYMPMMFVSNSGVEDFTNPEELLESLETYYKWMKDRKYARVELADREIAVLNSVNAAAMFELVGYDGSGNELGRFDATYAFIKEDETWKIVVATLLNHNELNELVH